MTAALAREKQFKNWKRDWKNGLIAKTNPDWRDLGPEMGITDALVQEIAGQARNDGYITFMPAGAAAPRSSPVISR